MENDDNPVPSLIAQLINALGQRIDDLGNLNNAFAQRIDALDNSFGQLTDRLDSFTYDESINRRTDQDILGRMSEKVLEIEELIRTSLDNDDQPPLVSNRESSINSSQATSDPERDTGAEQESAVLAPVMQKMSDMQEQVDEMGAHVDKVDARMRRLRLWARLVPLYLIVVVLVSYPYVAAITGMSASDMTQYISPVTGLAGAVIGYWFGQTGPGSGPGD